MKKLLLSAVAVALFVTNADGSLLQTKSSKVNVDTQLKNGMGNHYKGMISFVHSMLVGWADAFSYAAKAPEFADSKTHLNNASKKLKTISELTKSMLKKDRINDITKKRSSASAALATFQQAINPLIGTEYWKHCGAQLRFSIIAISNALKSLVYPNVEFDVGGIRYSASQGLIDASGDSVENDLIANKFSSGGQPASQTSQVIELASGFNNLANEMPSVKMPQVEVSIPQVQQTQVQAPQIEVSVPVQVQQTTSSNSKAVSTSNTAISSKNSGTGKVNSTSNSKAVSTSNTAISSKNSGTSKVNSTSNNNAVSTSNTAISSKDSGTSKVNSSVRKRR